MSKKINYRFSQKHIEYMRRAMHCCINVAEGAVRAGKTVDNVLCFAYLLERSSDRLHLATGSTASNALINIGDCNGMGLEHIFRGRCRYVRFKGSEALKVNTASGEKIIIFAGAGKSDSYKKIRGNSYGMWIATEINLHHSSAIKEAFNRQLAAKDRKIFWDLNPENPKAEIYKDYLDVYAEKERLGLMAGGYNYQHFTIFDNLSVSEERVQEITGQYDKNSIWYRRDILGERCSAEGLVYPAYPDLSEVLTVDLSDGNLRNEYSKRFEFIDIGLDFGGNRSLTAFVATGIHKGRDSLTVVADGCISGKKGEIDPDRVNKELFMFIERVKAMYPYVPIRTVRPDCAEQYLISGMRSYLTQRLPDICVSDSVKNPIIDRIRCLNYMISARTFAIEKSCTLVDDGIRSAVWDKNFADKGEDRRADNFTSNIDIMDAFEYSFENYMTTLKPASYQQHTKSQIVSGGLSTLDFTGGWS